MLLPPDENQFLVGAGENKFLDQIVPATTGVFPETLGGEGREMNNVMKRKKKINRLFMACSCVADKGPQAFACSALAFCDAEQAAHQIPRIR